jgi:regulatory protein
MRQRAAPAERRARNAAVDDRQVVLDAALRFLEARQRSTAEVRRRLVSAGYQRGLVEGAIERLTELGMLDDEAFARAWLESRDRARPRGERALRRELTLKGIERRVVDERLEERAAGAPDADAEAARRLLARHVRSLERVADPRTRRQRAYALLARNGFDSETATTVIGEVLGSS